MNNMTKHTGVLNNTGARVVVVYRKVPDDEEFCLVTSTDSLPDKYHDGLMSAVQSAEGQAENDFYNVLNRTLFSDGQNALQVLHFKGHLQKQPISNVTLYPFPGRALPLALVNAEIDGSVAEYRAAEDSGDIPVVEERTHDLNDPKFVAEGLILQAELLEADAMAKRTEAYAMDPSLDVPEETKRGRPKLTDAEKAASAERRKEKRRERDRAKAAEKREKTAEDDARALVDDKIVRDAERISETG
jgi:hypothetical protein